MAVPLGCDNPILTASNIERLDAPLTSQFKIRFKKVGESDSSYIPVTTTKDFLGVEVPFFSPLNVSESGDYIVHSYSTAGGTSTGTKITIHIECETVGT